MWKSLQHEGIALSDSCNQCSHLKIVNPNPVLVTTQNFVFHFAFCPGDIMGKLNTVERVNFTSRDTDHNKNLAVVLNPHHSKTEKKVVALDTL